MKPHLFGIVVLLIIVAVPGSQVISQNPDSTTKPLYRPTGSEASVVGTVSVSGEIPKPTRIDMFADPVCVQLNRKPETQWIIANGDKLKNVLVFVKRAEVLDYYRFEQSESEAMLDHLDCQYSPRVQGVRVGQRLLINNRDQTQHNAHPVPVNNAEWNQSQPANVPPLVKVFSRSEVAIPFKDNQHPWEKAYVGVFDHPFFAVSDEFGNFQINGLPPGKYVFGTWHERWAEQEIEVTLVPGEHRSLDFTFKVEALKKQYGSQ